MVRLFCAVFPRGDPLKRRDFLQYLGATGASLTPAATAFARLQVEPTTAQAPAIFLNQLGYLPAGSKQATIRLASIGATADTTARDFALHAGNAVVFRGKTTKASADAASGDTTATADFSAFQTPGTYHLVFDDLVSDPFPIREHAYSNALRVTMRGFYGQRCGCAVDLGGGYRHPACHTAGAFHPTSGKDGPLVNHGGWHDAGDYGRYIVNSGISTGTLLWAWELYPQPLTRLALALPESGRRLPDYLAEVRWNLEWMLTLQDTDGGVWHKQTSEHFCTFILPQDDHLTSYVIGCSPAWWG